MALGDQIGKQTVEELNADVPQWIAKFAAAMSQILTQASSYRIKITIETEPK